MNFEQVKSFISVAETGNFSASARQRFLSQPTISNQIRQLEEELGIRLFVRNSQKVTLTDAGMNFYKYANKLLAVEKDIYMNIGEKEERHYRTLSIGAPHLQTERQMNSFFRRACQEYGTKISCRIVERNDKDIPELILDGELELGVCNAIVKNDKLEYEQVFVEQFVLVTPNKPRYQNLTGEQIDCLIEDHEHIICEYKVGNDLLWDDLFEQFISKIMHDGKMYARCPNLNMQIGVIEAGLGIGFMPNTFAHNFWKEGKVLIYHCDKLITRPLYVVCDKERVKSTKVVNEVKELLVNELRKSINNED